jgi:hypothetical protein
MRASSHPDRWKPAPPPRRVTQARPGEPFLSHQAPMSWNRPRTLASHGASEEPPGRAAFPPWRAPYAKPG